MQLSDSMASATKPYQDFSSPSRRARFRPIAGVTKKSFQIDEFNKKRQPYSPQTPYSHQAHRLTIMVVIFTVPSAVFDASHICNDSVMSNRSLTERKLSLLCHRHVTLCTEEEAVISFRNVALWLTWKPMSGRDLARLMDKPRWFEFRVVGGFRAQVLPPMLDFMGIQVSKDAWMQILPEGRRRRHRATDNSMRADRIEHRTTPS